MSRGWDARLLKPSLKRWWLRDLMGQSKWDNNLVEMRQGALVRSVAFDSPLL